LRADTHRQTNNHRNSTAKRFHRAAKGWLHPIPTPLTPPPHQQILCPIPQPHPPRRTGLPTCQRPAGLPTCPPSPSTNPPPSSFICHHSAVDSPQNPKNQTHSPTRSASQSHDSPTLSFHNHPLSYPNAILSSHNPAKSSQKPLPSLRPSNLSRCQTLIPPSNTNRFQSSAFNSQRSTSPSHSFHPCHSWSPIPQSAIRNPQ
jgi:hypothetical protein